MFPLFRKSKHGYSIEIEDISIDSIIQKKHKNSVIASQRKETTIGERAFIGLFISFFALIIALLGVCFFYQVINKGNFIARAEKNKYIFNEISTQRGIIYDTNLKKLAENEQIFNLVLEEEVDDNSILEVSKILGLDFNELKQKVEGNEEGKLYIAKDLEIEQVIVLKTRINDLKGFKLEKKNIRNYEDGYAFSHILGYVSKEDGSGKDGIEKEYEDVLKENPGITKYERDALGNVLSEELVKAPESGKSLILNIDKKLQEKSFEVLESVVKSTKAVGGSIIIMNPKTGGVLTLVNYPSYNNNFFSRNFTNEEYQELLSSKSISFFNRGISGEYPIGSTIKPLLATAFLEEGTIDPNTKINCEGGITLNDRSFKSDWTAHGYTDMRKAIAESCDVYFYVLGGGYKNIKGLGIDKIDEYLYKYGLEKETGIDLPSESTGFIPTPEWKEDKKGTIWYPGDTYNISIGQGYLKATPIQVLTAIASIANNGKIMKPQIVKGIVDDNKSIVELFKPEVVDENFISQENLKVVQEGMRQTVLSNSGSAPSLQTLPISLAAKTGTAETGTGNTYHNWIVVYGPYEDPEISMIVLVEHVSSFGGITQSIVREVFNYYYENNIDKETHN
ncbi:MAG: penicillin-binding protein 2 [Candidatus Pacebacteria bacterium]|nr:penicillin-binding protein 2 [Candidatus Paceibacterota bacterium]